MWARNQLGEADKPACLLDTEGFYAPFLAFIDHMPCMRMGFMPQAVYEQDLLPAAVEAARNADVALVFVGNTSEWETEGKL